MADEKHFVDKHRTKLIERVSNIAIILDKLLEEDVIQQETYDKIRALPTSQDKMRELFSGALEASGVQGKEMFYKILNKHESYLINDLKTTEVPVEPMMAKKLLFETLNDLSSEELHTFKSLFELEKGFPLSPRSLQDTVELMVETYSHECVELTKKVLKTMNRTDLVQRLSDISSGTKAAGSSAEASGVSTTEKEKHSVDEHWPALIPKVETMAPIIELLLETLEELSDGKLQKFKKVLVSQTGFRRYFSVPPRRLWGRSTDRQAIVFSLVLTYGKQSVEKTKEVLKNMKRTDLVQKLSDSSSAPKKKHSVDEYLSVLIHKVATMSAVKELLLETLRGLSSKALKTFKWLLQSTFFQRSVPDSSWRRLQWTNRADKLVDVMLELYGQQSVEVTKEVLMEMKRTDLVQKLSDSSSAPTKKHSDEHRPALIQRGAAMTAMKQVLLETLKDLSNEDLWKFKWLLQFTLFQKSLPLISWSLLDWEDTDTLVDRMLKTCGQQSVEVTREVLMDMNRTDLVRRLSKTKEEVGRKRSIESQVAVLEGPRFPSSVISSRLKIFLSKPSIPSQLASPSSPPTTAPLSILPPSPHPASPSSAPLFPHISVSSSGLQPQFLRASCSSTAIIGFPLESLALPVSTPEFPANLEKRHSEPLHKEVIITSLMEKLLETMEYLSYGELEQFKHVLQYTRIRSFPRISGQRMETADRDEMVELMVEIYGQQSVEVTREVLMKIHRRDLVQRLSETSSGLQETHQSKRLHKAQGATGEALNWDPLGRDSTPGIDDCPLHDWTKLEPEVNSPDADEAPTYSLQSEAGNFECSVSGLRWVCKEKVSFKYQFCSWEGIMERMESLQYMPAGPLMDITVIAGKFDEAYLPHWICIADNPKILDKFAVLHIDDCGDVVEKVSEVTSSHVKLSEPIFSPRAALMKMGLPVKIGCQVLIYYIPKSSFLRLHVYLIPHDHGLQQTVDKNKEKKGYKRIEKPRPDKYLKMQQGFKLAADTNMAKILPEEITLRYDSQDPNFYEVFIENPDTNFQLTLSPLNKKKKKKGEPQCEPVWICEIQKVDYQDSADSEETCGQSPVHGLSDKKPSLDGRLAALMEKAATVTTDRERILIMLQDLNQQEFKQFIWQLEYSDIGEGRERIPSSKLENSDMFDLVNQMWKTYIQQSVEVTMKVLKQINRNDLVQILSVTSS